MILRDASTIKLHVSLELNFSSIINESIAISFLPRAHSEGISKYRLRILFFLLIRMISKKVSFMSKSKNFMSLLIMSSSNFASGNERKIDGPCIRWKYVRTRCNFFKNSLFYYKFRENVPIKYYLNPK